MEFLTGFFFGILSVYGVGWVVRKHKQYFKAIDRGNIAKGKVVK